MPTLALVNSVSFNQMKIPRKGFNIRVWELLVGLLQDLSISYFFHWDSTEE
jgi:hypothetical protein